MNRRLLAFLASLGAVIPECIPAVFRAPQYNTQVLGTFFGRLVTMRISFDLLTPLFLLLCFACLFQLIRLVQKTSSRSLGVISIALTAAGAVLAFVRLCGIFAGAIKIPAALGIFGVLLILAALVLSILSLRGAREAETELSGLGRFLPAGLLLCVFVIECLPSVRLSQSAGPGTQTVVWLPYFDLQTIVVLGPITWVLTLFTAVSAVIIAIRGKSDRAQRIVTTVLGALSAASSVVPYVWAIFYGDRQALSVPVVFVTLLLVSAVVLMGRSAAGSLKPEAAKA